MPEGNLFDIKKRIAAARQTRKITHTMELTASSRLQRGKVAHAACRAWLDGLAQAARVLPDDYFEPRGEGRCGRDAYLVFGGNQGLSGAYSPNLLRYAREVTAGQTVLTAGTAALRDFPDALRNFGAAPPAPALAAEMAQAALELRASGAADEVYLVYTRGTKQVTERLCPPPRPGEPVDMVLLEPSGKVLFPALLELYTTALVYEAHLQAHLAEQVARVAAMDSASRNADEIIDDLQAKYNRIRQGNITQEILTVGGGRRGERT